MVVVVGLLRKLEVIRYRGEGLYLYHQHRLIQFNASQNTSGIPKCLDYSRSRILNCLGTLGFCTHILAIKNWLPISTDSVKRGFAGLLIQLSHTLEELLYLGFDLGLTLGLLHSK